MKQLQHSIIKLAENPLAKADDDSMDYEKEEEESSMDEVNKGKTVSGPRTKLSNAAEERFAKIENGMAEIAKAVSSLAKSNGALIAGLEKGFGGGFAPEEEDPMAGGDEFGGGFEDEMGGGAPEMGGAPGDEFGGGDDLDLAGNMFGGEFDPYGGEQQAQQRGGDVTMQLRPDQMQLNRGKVSKDDSSSNFGEKDSDIPGNRKLDPDNKEKSAEEVLIQGGPSAGYSVNKALVDAVAKAVVSQLNRSKVTKSANSPDVSNSQIAKAETAISVDALVQDAAKLSFQDLNRKRIEGGLLSGGIL